MFCSCSKQENKMDPFVGMTILDTQKVEKLIIDGYDVNSTNPQPGKNESLIHHAVRKGASATVKMLIEQGANIESRSPTFDKTPIFYAAYSGSRSSIGYLLDAGADATAVDSSGNNCLREALIGCGFVDVVETLLKAGASLEHKNQEGLTMREVGLKYGNEEIKAFLNKN